MIFDICIVCNTKNIRFLKNYKKNMISNLDNNHDRFSLNLILQNNDLEIVDIYKCKRCQQKTIKIIHKSTGKNEQLWWEYFSNLKLIEKEVDEIKHKIHNLDYNDKENDAVKKKKTIINSGMRNSKIKKRKFETYNDGEFINKAPNGIISCFF